MNPLDDKAAFEAAMDALRTAHRQNSHKGDKLKEWMEIIDDDAISAASFVTERKQIYNRVGEQFDRAATDVIFLAATADIVEPLAEEAKKKAYPALRTVAIFRHENAEYALAKLMTREAPDLLATRLLTLYDGATELFQATPIASAPEQPPYSLLVKWEIGEQLLPSSEELVGLDDSYIQALTALRSGKNVILLGPPGTGKSRLASYICTSLQVDFRPVTATAEWTTFDTIGGYFPTQKGEQLQFQPGVITRSIEDNKWVVIDEINRADIDKAFGELFSVLSNQPVTLPYTRLKGDKHVPVVLGAKHDVETEYGISLSENWRIIGTMNTADKSSLFRMSAAFMRRFAFVEVPIPTPAEFAELIAAQFPNTPPARLSAIDNSLIEHLTAAFANDDAHSIRGGGLAIGPAIVLDLATYLLGATKLLEADYQRTILSGYSMFVLPQLEGRDSYYDRIANRLPALLRLEELPPWFVRELRDWLGMPFEEDQ